MRRLFAWFGALLLSACGGSTDEDKLIPAYPTSGCPPSHEKIDGVCTVKEVYFPGGTFVLGAGHCAEAGALRVPPDLTQCPLADQPRTVNVKPFWVDVTLRTADSFPPGTPEADTCKSRDLVCGKELHAPLGAFFGTYTSDPADAVAEVQESCARFGKRWLTEAEWEYIVTAGGTRKFPWGDRAPRCSDANLDFARCGNPNAIGNGAQPEIALVATYAPSPEGVYDLIGGFWEMLAPATPDVYGDAYTEVPLNLPACPQGPGGCLDWPEGIPNKLATVARGGSSRTSLADVDPTIRQVSLGASTRAGGYAWRCARSAQ
jgi:formylglycine-generating enzyme required for sulfatase activity